MSTGIGYTEETNSDPINHGRGEEGQDSPKLYFKRLGQYSQNDLIQNLATQTLDILKFLNVLFNNTFFSCY